MKTTEQLAAAFEAAAMRARDASCYWRVNAEMHGHHHWITVGLWQQLNEAWLASNLAWQDYDAAYQREVAGHA